MSDLLLALLAIFVLAEAAAILALARAIGVLQLRLPEQPALATSDGIAVGTPVPSVAGYELHDNGLMTLDLEGRWIGLFVSATCSICLTLAREVGSLRRNQIQDARILVVARGQHAQNDVFARRLPGIPVFSDASGDIHAQFRLDRSPYAFIVADGRILSKGVVNTLEQLELLLEGRQRSLSEPLWIPELIEKDSPELEPAGGGRRA